MPVKNGLSEYSGGRVVWGFKVGLGEGFGVTPALGLGDSVGDGVGDG